jgi:hypothetical protein
VITNPFARKPKSPIDEVLDVIGNVRADAAETAATIRDAAAKAADVLGEATPDVGGGRRLPVLGLVAAAGLGVAIAIKARAGGSAEPQLSSTPTQTPRPTPAAATAAKATKAPAPKAAKEKPAAEVEPEQPKEPKADTAEGDAASK